MTGTGRATGASAVVEVFDGTGKLWSGHPVLITVLDGNQHMWSRGFHADGRVRFTGLPLQDNFADRYTFLAAADHYRDAGFFPVRLSASSEPIVSLMLIPKRNAFNFARSTWPALGQTWPELKALLSGGGTPDEAEERYGRIQEDSGGDALACLLNIATAMRQIHLRQKTAFGYLRRIVWEGNRAPAPDRLRGRTWGLSTRWCRLSTSPVRRLSLHLRRCIRAQPGVLSKLSLAKPMFS